MSQRKDLKRFNSLKKGSVPISLKDVRYTAGFFDSTEFLHPTKQQKGRRDSRFFFSAAGTWAICRVPTDNGFRYHWVISKKARSHTCERLIALLDQVAGLSSQGILDLRARRAAYLVDKKEGNVVYLKSFGGQTAESSESKSNKARAKLKRTTRR